MRQWAELVVYGIQLTPAEFRALTLGEYTALLEAVQKRGGGDG